MEKASGLSAAANGFPGFFVGGTAALGFALIPELFTFGEGKFYFHSAVLEVHSRRNQRKSLLLGLSDQLANLFGVGKQFSSAQRSMIKDVSVNVGADVAIEKPELSIFDKPVRIFEID